MNSSISNPEVEAISPSAAPINTELPAITATAPARPLDPAHAEYLSSRGVSPLVAHARGYFSCNPVPHHEDSPAMGPIQYHGWSKNQIKAFRSTDSEGNGNRALVLPLWAGGEWVNNQIRLDLPRQVLDEKATKAATAAQKAVKGPNGIELPKPTIEIFKSIKFETPAYPTHDEAAVTNPNRTQRGSEDGDLPADIHPLAEKWVDDTAIPVLLTEGIPKADAALSEALRTGLRIVPVALTGVTMGYHGGSTTASGEPRLVDETLGQIPWEGRTVFMVWDADWRSNKMVLSSLKTTAKLLEAEGAIVHLVDIPATEDQPGRGLDDFLAAARANGDANATPLADLLNNATTTLEVIVEETTWFSADDVGRSERLASHCLMKRDAVYNLDCKSWMRWNGIVWERDATPFVTHRAVQLTARDADNLEYYKASRQARAIAAAVNLAAIQPGISRSEIDFDADPNLLNTPSGMVDLMTGVLLPHDPAAMQTVMTTVGYDPAAPAPTWARFLRETFGGDKELISYVQRGLGSSLFGSVREEFMLLLNGSGNNGKTVLVDALVGVLGEGYSIPIDPDMLLGRMSDEQKAELKGRRAAIAQETGVGRSLDEGAMKQITSRDSITARHLFSRRFSFRPSHTVIMATNHLPGVLAQDHGTWRRLKLVPFAHTVAQSDVDRGLGDKLSLEAAGILAWLVRGAVAFWDNGLGSARAIDRATVDWRGSSDTLGQFLSEECTVGLDASNAPLRGHRASIYRHYVTWSLERGSRPWSQKALTEALIERGVLSRESAAIKSSGAWFWVGFQLNEAAQKRATF